MKTIYSNILLSLFICLSCEKESVSPVVTTIDNIKSCFIEYTTVLIEFSIKGNCFDAGVLLGCEQELSNPKILSAEKVDTQFRVQLEKLEQGTEYFYKVFVEDKKGNKIYSDIKNFITKSSSVTTGDASDITYNSATVSLSFSGANIKEAGIIYTTDELCKDSILIMSNSEFIGSNLKFDLKDIIPGTTYYYKAYIKYQNGKITYGEIKSFHTIEQYLKVSTTMIEATAEGGNYQFEIEAKNVEWEISSDQDWCTINPITGSGNMIINISLSANESTNNRTAKITVKGAKQNITLNIIQNSNDIISINNLSTLAQYCGSSGRPYMYFTINSNDKYNIYSDDEWCNIHTTSGIGDGIVYYSVKENIDNHCRIATINIEFSNETQHFYVLQNYNNNPIKQCGVRDNSGGFKIESSTNWTAKSNKPWCIIQNSSGKSGDILHYSLENNSNIDRIATITIESNGYSSLYMIMQRKKETYLQSKLPSYDMIFVEGGTFIMGSDLYSNTRPSHNVTLSDYYIGKHEVSQKLWKYVMQTNPSYYKGDNLPVERVSWDEIQIFIERLNNMTGLNYRLPTEAEWEFAASGGIYSKGYTFSGSNNFEEVGWNDIWYYSGHTTVWGGMKTANELGIYDMTGNVGEVCSDWYGNYPSTPQINPKGPLTGSERIIRGEKSSYIRGNCTGDIKERYHSSVSGGSDFGIRLVLDK